MVTEPVKKGAIVKKEFLPLKTQKVLENQELHHIYELKRGFAEQINLTSSLFTITYYFPKIPNAFLVKSEK